LGSRSVELLEAGVAGDELVEVEEVLGAECER
jgi:hypothetical protein